MKDLRDCTFIIPVKIEHPDRYNNARSVLGFLNHNFTTNVIIYEVSEDGESKLDFLQGLENLEISHKIDLLPPAEPFHRTRYLNVMLDEVRTPVVVNYDIDVFLPAESYITCRDKIVRGEVDVYYPYAFGASQYQVLPTIDRSKFHSEFSMSSILSDSSFVQGGIRKYYSEYGHCIFFNTEVYKKFGGENEDFISYGPEDKERGIRFRAFGKKVEWLNDVVFHFEHHRGNDSSMANPYLRSNNELFSSIESSIGEGRISDYYAKRPYYDRYKTIGKDRNDWPGLVNSQKNLENSNPLKESKLSPSNPLSL